MPRMLHRARRRPAVQLSVEPLEERALPSAWHFDFGTTTSPAAPGYTGVAVQAYGPALGYGWQSTRGVTAVDRGTSDPLARDFHQAHEGVFQADVANDFNGTAPGAGWVTNPWDWAGGGPLSATASGGVLTLTGGQLRSAQPFSGAGVEGFVSFAGAPGQCFGLASDAGSAAGNYWA